jgi:hypothetical protein
MPELLFISEIHTDNYQYVLLYIHLSSIFRTVYPCFAFKKYTIIRPISGSRVLVRTLAGRFVILLRHLVGLLWTSDQPVAKASTYIKNATQKRKIFHALMGIGTLDLGFQTINVYG